MPKPVSSTKPSPTYLVGRLESTADKWIAGVSFVSDRKMSIKHRSHKKGPIVDPCPGPNSRVSAELEYISSEIP